jgi:predicted RNase H-like HicB family nuclease
VNCFLVIIENSNGNYSAYSPDLLGCVATGKSRPAAERAMHKAIQMHLHGLKEDGLPIPLSQATAEVVAVG